MPYLISLLLVIFLILCLLFSGNREKKQACAAGPTPAVVLSAGSEAAPFLTAGLTREEVHRQLEKLGQSQPPAELKTGAMCYAPMAIPQVVDYVCPVCGQKTIYAASKGDNVQQIRFTTSGLPGCRQLIKHITAVSLELDESELCRKCSPKAVNPHVWLVVKYPGRKPWRVRDVTLEDLRLIDEFFSGKDKHRTFNDGETPLKNYLPRLKVLLEYAEPASEGAIFIHDRII